MKKKHKILIVDDAEINRSMLSDMLSNEYEIMEAANGIEAITILNNHNANISLVLLDIVMPIMDGFEVLGIMNKYGWTNTIPVIVISAETSSVLVNNAYELGAVEYISRPFDFTIVRYRVRNTIMLYSKQKHLENVLIDQVLEKEKNNLLMIEILSHIVEFRNGESGLHIIHIRAITELLLRALKKISSQYVLDAETISLIVNASALHDIGKISIPDQIINKPGKLTKEEFEIMKTHTTSGAQILENISFYEDYELIKVARDICLYHHERYDGKGYPEGLKGEEIPLSAQVVALADVYDALTSIRVYKPKYTHEQAMKMIMNGECGTFNPILIRCLLEIEKKLEKELSLKSLGFIPKNDIQQMTQNLLKNADISNRTLALLEQERKKYQFFASLSNEIQFEYSYNTDTLSVSEWGSNQFGIPSIIVSPEYDGDLKSVFMNNGIEKFKELLHECTPDKPVFQHIFELNIFGNKRYYKMIAQPLWLDEDNNEVNSIIGKLIDVHEEQIKINELKHIATYDFLTGLYNRNYASQMIEEILRKSVNEKYAMIIFDLDFFKNANDQYGHIFGDKVLIDTAQKLKKCTREQDIIARLGGDEFLTFLQYRTKSELQAIVKRMFKGCSGLYQNFNVTISMGIALFPEDGLQYEKLFHRSDQALYTAKYNGKKCYCFYDNTMHNILSNNVNIEDNE